ncbi:hypothetical protein GLOIN_2v1804648 [Rhizophagus clarus]|uniref:Uncharacterized protein n=1 Tax=Rhizophagus clarus TaxID=94130 RepID=A0A8H3KYH3_9GLOM|nr:hypothetical protein GLOIN_2v1804648 [Rhizophagus clarus]
MTLRKIVETGLNEQPMASSALDTFENTKQWENVLAELDYAFTVERTLNHINEEGESSTEVILRKGEKFSYAESSSEADSSDDYIEESKRNKNNPISKQYVREENNWSEKKKLFEEIERILQSRNKLVLEESILKKLEEARFLFFMRHALLAFVAMFKYLTPKVLDRDMEERSYIVECLSPILGAFQNAFPDVKYE